MILIAADRPGPRLRYAAFVLCTVILRVDHEVIALEEIPAWLRQFPTASLVYYVKENLYGEDKNVIPAADLLWEENIRPQDVSIEEGDPPVLRFPSDPSARGDFSFPFDLLAASFYLLTEYEKQVAPKYDRHGRYEETAYLTFQQGFHRTPLVHRYAQLLWDTLYKRNPILHRETSSFDYQITFDIDSPYLYRGKPLPVLIGGAVKELLTFRFSKLGERISTLGGGHDPYDVFDDIFEMVPAEKLTFFFLGHRGSAHDGRHLFSNKTYQHLIRKLKERGASTGIHPSYTSFLDEQQIKAEKESFEKITGAPITQCRMHFLKYRLPETYRHLISAGIKEDYTTCLAHDLGFRHGMARPFPWFDLQANRQTELILVPTLAMDRTLLSYLKKSPAEAHEALRDIIGIVHKYDGLCTLLFHNDALSERGEWKGWREVFFNTVKAIV